MVADSGATSSCGRVSDPFITTGKPSTKTFHTPFGQVAEASEAAQLHLNTREPVQTVYIILGLQHNSLLSISKFAVANYLMLITPEDVQIFDGDKATIASSAAPVLQVWRETKTGLWWVSIFLKHSTTNKTMQQETTLLMNINQN